MRRLILLVLLCFSALTWADMSPKAKAYLDNALDVIQKNSSNQKADFKEMRRVAYAKVPNAQTPEDTYPGVQAALAYLDDYHGEVRSKEVVARDMAGLADGPSVGLLLIQNYVVRVMPGGSAEKAGVKVGMQMMTCNGAKIGSSLQFDEMVAAAKKPLDVVFRDRVGRSRRMSLKPVDSVADVPPSGRMLPGGYAYLDVPGFASESDLMALGYAAKLQNVIQACDVKGLKGWIIDLRLNSGGNTPAMVDGLNAILGNGVIGYTVTGKERKALSLQDGRVLNGGVPFFAMDSYQLVHRGLPVVVLIEHGTASAGEITALAFRGRSKSCLMGSATAGMTSTNTEATLADGSVITVGAGFDADRTGRVYEDSIQPDKAVDTDWSLFGTDKDPVILAAERWIRAAAHNRPKTK